jgi:hypothetical protein
MRDEIGKDLLNAYMYICTTKTTYKKLISFSHTGMPHIIQPLSAASPLLHSPARQDRTRLFPYHA